MVPVVSVCSCSKRVGDTVFDLIPDFGLISAITIIIGFLRVDSKETWRQKVLCVYFWLFVCTD
jgi:hypothetical protein